LAIREKQKFTQTIEKLKEGDNFVKWDLMEKSQKGGYTLSVSVEILSDGLTYEVAEKKAQTE